MGNKPIDKYKLREQERFQAHRNNSDNRTLDDNGWKEVIYTEPDDMFGMEVMRHMI